MTVISDTSVLCYLAQLGQLDLLRHLFGTVVLPAELLAECRHPNAPAELQNALSDVLPAFIKVQQVTQNLPETAALDSGEAAPISLAWQHRPDALALIDERTGRAIARALGLRVRGLLALLADGHRQQFLDFDACNAMLQQHGFRAASPLLQSFRRELRLPESPHE
jgi:predicted nucleic acid-binding protein